MTPGAEQDSGGAGQGDAALTETLERLQAENPGPRTDRQLAERVRAFVAKLRDGKVRTVADERALTDQLIADVQAIDGPQASPIDPVQAP
jgi:hypothetical protein